MTFRLPPKLAKRLKLLALALLGLSAVSIPVTVAVVMSATGGSDLFTIGGAEPRRQHATPARAVADLRCRADRGFYALTFDDGPVPRSTPRLVAALRRARAVATFFDIGSRAAARQDLVELQRRVGQVASHGFTHAPLPPLSPERRIRELQVTARVLDYPNVFVRPPAGATSARADEDIRRSGLTPVYWTVDAADTGGATVREIVSRALAVRPGGIIRLHDGIATTVVAVPLIVGELRRRGLCPGLLAPTRSVVTGANGARFHVVAVKP